MRQRTPYRIVNDRVVVARPSNGHAIVLSGPTAVAWLMDSETLEVGELAEELRRHYGTETGIDLTQAAHDAVEQLRSEGLVA